MSRMIKLGVAAGITLAIAAGFAYTASKPGRDVAQYQLVPAARGPIASTVTATGTLHAVVTVEVGTQVSGLVKTLHADFNSEVAAGEVIARIDAKPFAAVLRQAEAEHAIARANLEIQQASLVALEAELAGHRAAEIEAGEELERQRLLLPTKTVAASTVATALATARQSQSRVQAALARIVQQRAQIALASAQILKATAALQQRQLDLEYTKIRSPVKGVVIDRSVNAGQTVAASLQAPVLFRIAGDLRRMEVRINVDEADIGKVHTGDKVYFAVDSFMNETFEGRVQQIRKSGEQISNVVTYTVVANADNEDNRLLPGMTANVTVLVSEREDALLVPSSALRLQLPDTSAGPVDETWVWVLDEAGQPQRKSVVSGISDGNSSEIVSGDLAAAQSVIVGLAARQ